jgi:hypothetical protein
LKSDPAKWREFLETHRAPAPESQPTPTPSGVVGWQRFPTAPDNNPLSNPLLMTDGSIIAHVSCTGL